MIEIARDAPGSIACGRSGVPLLAVCSCAHRRTVPFRLLKTSESDLTPIYGRPFRCRAWGNREVTLFNIESQAELGEVLRSLAGRDSPLRRRRRIRRLARTGICCSGIEGLGWQAC